MEPRGAPGRAAWLGATSLVMAAAAHRCPCRDSGMSEPADAGVKRSRRWASGALDHILKAGRLAVAGVIVHPRVRSEEELSSRTAEASSQAAQGRHVPPARELNSGCMPKWGRCGICKRAMVVRVRQTDGNPFLGCSRFPHCTYATSYVAAVLGGRYGIDWLLAESHRSLDLAFMAAN